MKNFLDENFISGNLNEQRKMIANICADSPMFNVITQKIHNRYLEDREGHWLADFATQSYLGFDFRPEVINAAIEATQKYGTVVPWCRLVATIDIFEEVETQVANLVGSESCNIFASTTLLNHGVIPAFAGRDGAIFLDKSGHATMYEGAKMARDSGCKLISFPSNDMNALEDVLKKNAGIQRKIILTDGVYSMTGEYADLKTMDTLAKKYGALLFVDDAHGFGVVGELPSSHEPYGLKGNGLNRYFDIDFDNAVYVGCFSKAYGTFGSFIACSERMRQFLLSQATPHDLGGHGPASAMSALTAGLKINQKEGGALRIKIWNLTSKVVKGLETLGYKVNNKAGFPIISVWLGRSDDMIEISKLLYSDHILLTLSPYPMVKHGEEALRITVTATNTEQEIDQLLKAFANLKVFLDEKGYNFEESF